MFISTTVNNMKTKYGNYLKRNFWRRRSMNQINLSVFINQYRVKARLDNWNSFEINISPKQHRVGAVCLCILCDLQLAIELSVCAGFAQSFRRLSAQIYCLTFVPWSQKKNPSILSETHNTTIYSTQTFTL